MAEKLAVDERRQRILDEASRMPSVKLNELAERFGVSNETIRRDFDYLSTNGLLTRTLGGAVKYPPETDLDFQARMQQKFEERAAIAEAAAPLVRRGETLFIGSGVSSLHFSKSLRPRAQDLTVLTASLRVANTLVDAPGCRVVLAPGELDGPEQAVSGPDTIAFLKRFRADSVFFGASGLTEQGVFESRSSVVWVLRTMLENAERAVLLSDSSNFGRRAFEHLVGLSAIDVLVTEASPAKPLADACKSASVQTVLAHVDASTKC